jgi:hypothetical protein
MKEIKVESINVLAYGSEKEERLRYRKDTEDNTVQITDQDGQEVKISMEPYETSIRINGLRIDIEKEGKNSIVTVFKPADTELGLRVYDWRHGKTKFNVKRLFRNIGIRKAVKKNS